MQSRWSAVIKTSVWCVGLVFFIRAAGATPTISVSGSIDGSGVMEVDANSVSWTNLYYGTPTALAVNGTAWNPSAQPTLNLGGPSLIPSDLNDYFVSTDVLSGRDVANAQIDNGHLFICFADTPNGADNYSIQVSFAPKPPPVASTSATLHVTAAIDGSDILRITNTATTWIHTQWAQPTNVELNGVAWDTVADPTLPNSGPSMFLPPGVDLSTVQFIKNDVRDTATYQLFPDHIDVYFADNPLGAGDYDIALKFGAVSEPQTFGTLLVGGALLLACRHRKKPRS